MSSTDSISPASTSAWPGRTGAKVMPQLPITTEVTPCQHDDDISGSQPIWASRWECRSTKPGVTVRPSASMTRPAPPASTSPTAVIRSPSTATSARRAGAPVPSTTVPSLITRSCAMRGPFVRPPTVGPRSHLPLPGVRVRPS